MFLLIRETQNRPFWMFARLRNPIVTEEIPSQEIFARGLLEPFRQLRKPREASGHERIGTERW